MESTNNTTEYESKYILPCIGGTLIPIITTSIFRPFELAESLVSIIFLMLLFLLVGFVSIARGATSKKRVLFLALAFLPVGVIINIFADSYIWDGDHNLFPIEFIIYPVIAFIPLLLGVYLGGIFSSNKALKRDSAKNAAPLS